MYYIQLDENNQPKFFIKGQTLPQNVIEIDQVQYHAYLMAMARGDQFSIVEGKVQTHAAPAPELTLAEQFHDIKIALQNAIDIKAASFGFSDGNSLMLYAGIPGAFQDLGLQFGAWESSVWVEAGIYKEQVENGDAAMLTTEEAVAMIPDYPAS